MYALLATLIDFAAARKARLGHAAIPRRLLEAAGRRSSAAEASDLRRNALAYLRVVR